MLWDFAAAVGLEPLPTAVGFPLSWLCADGRLTREGFLDGRWRGAVGSHVRGVSCDEYGPQRGEAEGAVGGVFAGGEEGDGGGGRVLVFFCVRAKIKPGSFFLLLGRVIERRRCLLVEIPSDC